MSLAGLGLQGITVSPRFIFGVNGELKNNLYMVDEHKILYTAGHNIVVYSTEEKNQYFLQGSENVEKITNITVSKSKKFLAICEKSQWATCTIYDIHSQKRKKQLPDPDVDCDDYKAQEFLSCAFAPKQESQFIITLTADPEWELMLWNWDQLKILSRINIGIQNIPSQIKGEDEPSPNFQITFHNFQDTAVVVTGMNTFKYYKIEDNEFQASHTQINNKDREITTKYSCHAWMGDGRLIVCTEVGEIIILEDDGEFVAYLPDSPSNEEDFKIEAITAMQNKGFIVSGNGRFYIYEKNDDERQPYRLAVEPMDFVMDGNKNSYGSGDDSQMITSMCLSFQEDVIYFISKNNQLMKVDVPLYDGNMVNKFEYLHCPFHQQEITGMDVCIRKQLIVTCSKDKSIKIWNYATKQLELQTVLQEVANAVAFHPSGFHVIVAVTDKLLLMNVLSKDIAQFRNIQLKHCSEVQFCNGGHLFAAAFGNKDIQVFNFYTNESPPQYKCGSHVQKVRSIDWFEHDMGFTSTGHGGEVYMWDLVNMKDGNNRILEWTSRRGVQMTSVVNVPGRNLEAYCCGSDGNIFNINQGNEPYEAGAIMSQLCMTHNAKALFAGVGQTNKPGAIQIFKVSEDQARETLKMDKINEVQAHSKAISRMKLSYDNHHLFSAGSDGCFIIHDVKDRDPKGKQREREGLPFSDEILTDKQDIEGYTQDKEQLDNELNGNNQDNFEKYQKLRKLDEKISKLQEELSSSQLQHRNRYDSLLENKRDATNIAEEQIKALEERNQQELDENRNNYSQKMLEDAARFQELQAKKEEETRNFEEIIADVIETHNLNVNSIIDQHKSLMEGQIAQTEQLKKEIERQQEDNEEILKQITQDAEDEEKDIESKNEQNKKQVNEMSLKSKAELQLTQNKLQDLGTDTDTLNRQIQDKNTQKLLAEEEEKTLQAEINKKKIDIEERDIMIGDKEKDIYKLKKKTQELEKFKFVLDYKIKELKRDIAPRGQEITRLKKETNDMDKNLKHYNRINANLGYIVDDLKTRQEHMQDMIRKNRTQIRSNQIAISQFKNAVYWVVQYIDDFDELKKIVNKNLYPYVRDQPMKNVEIDPDIKKEHQNQFAYLQNSSNSLQKRFEKERAIHKEENHNIMKENVVLIGMISDLRKKVKELKTLEKNSNTEKKMLENQSQMMNTSQRGSQAGDQEPEVSPERRQQEKELSTKIQYIEQLKQQLQISQQEHNFLTQEMGQQMHMQQM